MPAIFNSFVFLDPIETITAANFGEVTHILEFAEMRARAGAYVMVMLSYEAAPVFDSALCTHKPDDFPLAWAGVFSEPSDPPRSVLLFLLIRGYLKLQKTNTTNVWHEFES